MALTSAPGASERSSPQRWSAGDRITLHLVLLVLAWALAALALALVGWFHWWLVVPLALVLFVSLGRRVPEAEAGFDSWWAMAVVVAVVTLFVNGANPGEHLLTGRDSGTYMATAGWLAEESTLDVDARRGPLADIDGLGYVLPGFYEWVEQPGDLQPQFMHAFPAMLGTLMDLQGVSLSYWLNPALGAVLLLSLFSLARRYMSGWAALLTIAVAASSLVFLYFARTPFTEVLMATFVVSGLGLLGEAEERSDLTLGVIAGALLGATVLARVDGVVLLIPVTFYLLVRSRKQDGVELFRRAWVVMFSVAMVGLAESLLVSPAYILERARFVVPPLVVVLLMVVGNDVVGDRIASTWSRLVRPRRRGLFLVVMAVAGLALVYAWLVRPQLATPGLVGGDLAFVEAREGLQAEPLNYQALSVQWVTWYQGAAFVVMGFIGASLLGWRGVRGMERRPSWLPALVLATFTTLYVWRPAITPDHIWAMRRFLTVVIPLGALAAGTAVDFLHDWVSRRPSPSTRKLAPLVGALLSASLLVPTLGTSAPVWDVHEYEGLGEDMAAICESLGDDTSVLVVDYELAQSVVQSFRSYCGVPAAWTDVTTNTEIERIQDEVESAGGSLVVVRFARDEGSDLSGDYRRLEVTLSRAPSQTREFPISITIEQ